MTGLYGKRGVWVVFFCFNSLTISFDIIRYLTISYKTSLHLTMNVTMVTEVKINVHVCM